MNERVRLRVQTHMALREQLENNISFPGCIIIWLHSHRPAPAAC